MNIRVLTLFPEMFSALDHSIVKRAQDDQHVILETITFRDFSTNRHGKVDDYPYGGGAGMLLTPQPVFDAGGGFALRVQPRSAESEFQVASDRKGEWVWPLEDHRHAEAQDVLAAAPFRYRFPRQRNLSAYLCLGQGVADHAVQRRDKRGLSASRRADDRQHFAAIQINRYIGEQNSAS